MSRIFFYSIALYLIKLVGIYRHAPLSIFGGIHLICADSPHFCGTSKRSRGRLRVIYNEGWNENSTLGISNLPRYCFFEQ